MKKVWVVMWKEDLEYPHYTTAGVSFHRTIDIALNYIGKSAGPINVLSGPEQLSVDDELYYDVIDLDRNKSCYLPNNDKGYFNRILDRLKEK